MVMNTRDIIVANVFGKAGCDKCTMLKRRVTKLLEKPEYSAIEMRYQDLFSEDGLVQFCLAQCLNPSRVPALVMSRLRADGTSEWLANPQPGEDEEIFGKAKLYQYLGVQTDYGDHGRGIISPAMVETLFRQATAQCEQH